MRKESCHRGSRQQVRFDMMTSSNGNIFRVTGPFAGNSPVTDEFPSQRTVTRSFDVFFDLRQNIRLCKQSRRRWFDTQSRSLWRHCNGWLRFCRIGSKNTWGNTSCTVVENVLVWHSKLNRTVLHGKCRVVNGLAKIAVFDDSLEH